MRPAPGRILFATAPIPRKLARRGGRASAWLVGRAACPQAAVSAVGLTGAAISARSGQRALPPIPEVRLVVGAALRRDGLSESRHKAAPTVCLQCAGAHLVCARHAWLPSIAKAWPRSATLSLRSNAATFRLRNLGGGISQDLYGWAARQRATISRAKGKSGLMRSAASKWVIASGICLGSCKRASPRL